VQNKIGYLIRASSHAFSVKEERRRDLAASQHHKGEGERGEITSTLSTMTTELKKLREDYAKLDILYLEIEPGV